MFKRCYKFHSVHCSSQSSPTTKIWYNCSTVTNWVSAVTTYLTDFTDDVCVNDRCIDVTCSRKQIFWKINFEPFTQPTHRSIQCHFSSNNGTLNNIKTEASQHIAYSNWQQLITNVHSHQSKLYKGINCKYVQVYLLKLKYDKYPRFNMRVHIKIWFILIYQQLSAAMWTKLTATLHCSCVVLGNVISRKQKLKQPGNPCNVYHKHEICFHLTRIYL